MSWLSTAAFEPHLPDHCLPESDFLLRFSSTFHTCVPTPLAFTSNLLGTLSIVAWLFAQLPQIYKNWSLQSTSGLSIFFLVEWCLGDLGNLLGALFTHQASWQVTIGCYYVFVDLCLVGQWIWFEKLRHGHGVLRLWKRGGQGGDDDDDSATSGSIDQAVIEGMLVLSPNDNQNETQVDSTEGQDQAKPPARPRIIFRTPTFERQRDDSEKSSFTGTPNTNQIHRVGPSSPIPSPSPRTVLFIACLIAMAHASPVRTSSAEGNPLTSSSGPTPLETTGTILSWTSTILYLGSRLPQLYKNYRRKSTAGLSPLLFFAAFCGNTFYSSALLTNPCAWDSFGPHGGRGWVDRHGSERAEWVLAALPFFLGAAGVLGLDASMGVQFLIYGEGREKLVVVEEMEPGRRWHWRRVSGYIRGWIPSGGNEGKGAGEREALVGGEGNVEGLRREGYGAVA